MYSWFPGKRRRPHARPTRPRRRLCVEVLEDRTLLSGHLWADALGLAFQGGAAHASDFLSNPQDFRIYQLGSLVAGDTVNARVNAQQIGSSLDSLLRIFDSAGNPIASNDDFTGRDAQLSS